MFLMLDGTAELVYQEPGPAEARSAEVARAARLSRLQREREARYKRDRKSWRTRLREYQGARRCR